MNKPFETALIFLRLFGFICIFLSATGFAFVAGVLVFINFLGTPGWFLQSVAPYAVTSFISSPIWLIGGFIIIKFSRRLARFVAKASESNET